jgi:hypothetical protein
MPGEFINFYFITRFMGKVKPWRGRDGCVAAGEPHLTTLLRTHYPTTRHV